MNKVIQLIAVVSLVAQSTFAQDFTRKEVDAGISQRHIDEYIMGGGATFFDSNNDGFLDIYITGGEERDKLYISNQDDTYTDIAIDSSFDITDSVKTNGVCTGDIDNDGDRDIFITTGEGFSNLLFENQGDGTYLDISTSAGINDAVWSTSVTMGDYNLDGYLDIYVGNYVTFEGLPDIPFYEQMDEPIPNFFYVNNGDNTFTDLASTLNIAASGATLAVAFTDYDGDNDVDIYVANDFGGLFGKNSLFENNYPLNTFTDVGVTTGCNASINAMGIAIGDYNEDLHNEFYVTNMGGNYFYENDGDNTFSEIAETNLTECNDYVSWGTFFFDYNNDTYLDLYVANGGVLMQDTIRTQGNTLFTLDSSNLYAESMSLTGNVDSAISRGAITGDIDNDGDLDIFVVNISDTLIDFNVHLLQNNLSDSSSWLKIQIQGVTNNYDGFGTSILSYANGNAMIRQIDGGSSYESQNSSIAHFGLGDIEVLDSVLVKWLGGETQVLYDVASSQSIHIKEDNIYNFHTEAICDGDSIFFKDTWIHDIGTYYDTSVVALGLDSISALSVRITDILYTESEVEINAGDSIYLGGDYQTEEGIYIDTYISNAGCDSIVTTYLSIDFSSGIVEITRNDLNIYPNPSKGEFTIHFSNPTYITEISVYSIVGNEVKNWKVNNTVDKLDVNLLDQSEGIYFININTNDQYITKKVILNR